MDQATVEEWRVVEGFPRFRVSNHGNAQKLSSGGQWQPFKQTYNSSGYPALRVVGEDGRKRQAATHIFVAELFIGPRPSPAHEVMHLDGSRKNNRVENLRYGTRSENSRDALRHGTHQSYRNLGSRNGYAVLTEETARLIAEAARNGMRQSEIARRFNTSHANVRMVLIGRSWSHVTGIPKTVQKSRAA